MQLCLEIGNRMPLPTLPSAVFSYPGMEHEWKRNF